LQYGQCTVVNPNSSLYYATPRTLTGHTDRVNVIAFSVDGKYLISGSDDNTLKVWDWQTGVEVRTISGHTDDVNAIAFSVDGKYLISGSDDNTLKVWDWQTGEVIATFTGESAIRCCAVAGDRVSIVAGEASGRLHFLRLEGV
jgi:WD40 repeat protein